MLGGCDRFAVLLVGHRLPMFYELLACAGMLALGQTFKLFSLDGADQSPLAGKPSLPFAYHLSVLRIVTLVAVGKFLSMISCGLAGAQWFGDSQHCPLV